MPHIVSYLSIQGRERAQKKCAMRILITVLSRQYQGTMVIGLFSVEQHGPFVLSQSFKLKHALVVL
jgi:hypothetical protein